MVILLQIFCLLVGVLPSQGFPSALREDEDWQVLDASMKSDYFTTVEAVTPVLLRIPQTSSDPPKELAYPSRRHPLPKNLDLVLRRKKDTLRMRLHRMRDVIGSRTRVEWMEGDTMESKVLSTKCIYHGKVDGEETSLATIDLCNDMKGVIRTSFEDIYLHPRKIYAVRQPDKETYRDNSTRNDSDTHIIRVHQRPEELSLKYSTSAAINLTDDSNPKEQENSTKQDGSGSRDYGSTASKSRQKRQTLHRGPRYMQVLLVTDWSLVRFHGRSLIEQYLLTQMSIVDTIYHHPSLGFEINLVVVKIKILEDSVVRQIVAKNDGKTSLEQFCNWVSNEKPKNRVKDEDFDVAVYITKEEIGPAGYAPVTGMCTPIRSCALVRDDGTSSAFVIAHEIGHIFGMIHDGQGNNCDEDPSDGKVMASMVQSNYHSYYWSRCNREAMEKYLVDIHCLDDKPKEPSWPVYRQPFGQSWSLDEQCRQEFGSGFSLCRVFDHLDPCYHLWCSHSSNTSLCRTKRGPPLPGTSCGGGRWCINGSCVEKRSVAVDGGWAAWGNWEACSRSCGIGVQFRVRTCTQPRPKHGGRDCHGDREEFRTCNTQRCPGLSDYRAEQCEAFNEKRFDGESRHHWQPLENKNASEMCKLTCISRETKRNFVSESNVVDGTFCSYDQPHEICIKGACHAVGCDGSLNSRQREDQCGVCGGNGGSCRSFSGHFTDPLPKKEYHRILVIPIGARNIDVTERRSMPHLAHFIAVRDTMTEAWYLNGHTQQEQSKQFVVHGTNFAYSNKQKEGETLKARGPLLAPLDIMVYSMSSKLPPAIDYSYVIPAQLWQQPHAPLTRTTHHNRIETNQTRYVWVPSGWTNCSKPCGSGFQYEVFACVDTEKRRYSDGFCSLVTQPVWGKRECNTHACALYTYWWDAEEWSHADTCSASCGSHGVQQRRIQCVTDQRGQTVAINPAYCNQRTMPVYVQPCNRFACVPEQSTSTTPRSTSSTTMPSTSTRTSTRTSSTSVSTVTSRATTSRPTSTQSSTGSRPTTRSNSSSRKGYDPDVQNLSNLEDGEDLVDRVASTSRSSLTLDADKTTDPKEFLNISPLIVPELGTTETSTILDKERRASSASFSESSVRSTTGAGSQGFNSHPVGDVSLASSMTTPPPRTPRTAESQLDEESQQWSTHELLELSRVSGESEDTSTQPELRFEVSLPSERVLRLDSVNEHEELGFLDHMSFSTKAQPLDREPPPFPPSLNVDQGDPVRKRSRAQILDGEPNRSVGYGAEPHVREILVRSRAVRPSESTKEHSTVKPIGPSTFPSRLVNDLTRADMVTRSEVHATGRPTTPRIYVSPEDTKSVRELDTSPPSQPLRSKATVRKQINHRRSKPSNHAQSEEPHRSSTPKFDSGSVRAAPARGRGLENDSATADCVSDKSALFCKAGANRDRCAKATFFALCCVSCRDYVPSRL